MNNENCCWSITNIVEKGQQEARKLGCPTANIKYNQNISKGVYAGYIFIPNDNIKYKSCIYI